MLSRQGDILIAPDLLRQLADKGEVPSSPDILARNIRDLKARASLTTSLKARRSNRRRTGSSLKTQQTSDNPCALNGFLPLVNQDEQNQAESSTWMGSVKLILVLYRDYCIAA